MINEENIVREYKTWSVEGLLKTRGHIEQTRERLAHQLRYHEAEIAVIERLLAEKQAQENEDARTGLVKVNPKLRHLYEGAWGPFIVGDYRIGEMIVAPGTSGEVVWSYQTEKGLVYAIDNNSGWPVGVLASQVVSKVAPWK